MKRIIGICLIIIVMSFIFFQKYRVKQYNQLFYYLGTDIVVQFYTSDSDLANHVSKEIEKIYEKYDKLTNRYQEDKEVNNLYTIRNNFSKEKYLTIDNDLYKMIQYGLDIYESSNRLINISMGNVTDLWKTYRESKIGIPSKEELNLSHNQSIHDIILLDNNKIKNNRVNIDLDLIKSSYVHNKIKMYLENIGINRYFINAGDVIVIGDSYQEDYKIALQNPDRSTEVLKILNLKNKTIVTKKYSTDYYDYNNVRYHNIVHPNTLYPENNMKSVTVISNDVCFAEQVANILFLMSIDEGKEYIQSLEDIEVIWVSNNDEIISSK